jgi:hypothetical protein
MKRRLKKPQKPHDTSELMAQVARAKSYGKVVWRVVDPDVYAQSCLATAHVGTHVRLYRDPHGGICPVLYDGPETPEGFVKMLDARAVAFNETTIHIDYSPRYFPLDDHSPRVREWLIQHPRWGMNGSFDDWEEALRPGTP